MKVDAVVLRRMNELVAKGAAIAATKVYVFATDKGEKHYTISGPEPTGWATSVLCLLQRVSGESSHHHSQFAKAFSDFPSYKSSHAFARMQAVLAAAKDDYEGGYLFNVRALILAEAFADLVAQADALLESNYIIAAGALGRAAIEQHLRSWADVRGLSEEKPNGKPPMLGDFILWLKKGDAINAMQRAHLEAMAKVGNLAAHADPAVTSDNVAWLLREVREFLAKNPIS